MRFRDALALEILRIEPAVDKMPERIVTLDGSFRIWYDRKHARPYRYARETWADDGSAGQSHGGAASLEEALRATVVLRSRGCR